MRLFAAGAVAVLVLAASPALAADPPHPLLDAALRCRAETDEQARLRCYDAAMAPIQEGTAAGRIIMVERREVQRSLFGLSIPRFLRGGDDDEEEAPREIVTRVASARHFGYRNWVVELEEGGTWQTIENSSRQDLPRTGMPVRVFRSPIGAYWMSVNGQIALRARRVG